MVAWSLAKTPYTPTASLSQRISYEFLFVHFWTHSVNIPGYNSNSCCDRESGFTSAFFLLLLRSKLFQTHPMHRKGHFKGLWVEKKKKKKKDAALDGVLCKRLRLWWALNLFISRHTSGVGSHRNRRKMLILEGSYSVSEHKPKPALKYEWRKYKVMGSFNSQ